MIPLRALLSALPPPLRRQRLLGALVRSGLADRVQLLEFNDGARAWVDLRDFESRASYLAGDYWPEIHEIVSCFVRPGAHIFDIGANFGLVTFGTLPLVTGVPVTWHLFEANPRIMPILDRSVREFPESTFRLNHCCVTDSAGPSYFSVSKSHWGSGRVDAGGESVPSLVLDDYIVENRIDCVAFLKMDLEGWELKALAGGEASLSAGKVETMFVEISEPCLARVGATGRELVEQLGRLGFDVYFCGARDGGNPFDLAWARTRVSTRTLRFARAWPLPRAFEQGDVLAVHRSTSLARRLGQLEFR